MKKSNKILAIGVCALIGTLSLNPVRANASSISNEYSFNSAFEKLNAEQGECYRGWHKDEDGVCHYYDSKNQYHTGWLKVPQGDYNYYSYFDNNSSDNYKYLCYLDDNGIKTTGWKEIDGNRYFFYNNGIMATNVIVDGSLIGSDGIARKYTI